MHSQDIAPKAIAHNGNVGTYTTYSLNKNTLVDQLKNLNSSSKNLSSISLPIPTFDNKIQYFSIKKSTTLHPDLVTKFPTIQTYQGISSEHKNSTLRMEITPKGVFIMIWTPSGIEIIQPKTKDKDHLFIHYKKQDASPNNHYNCTTDDINIAQIRNQVNAQSRSFSDGQLKTYRLALACTGEYAQYHGGTTADALAAMATTMNRVNGIFMTELSLQFQIVANNDRIVFLNSATDPYDNHDHNQLLDANPDVCNEHIGAANYDIGHVFTTGGGGVARLNSFCDDKFKGGGVSGLPNPVGDPFDIDFVAHEIGHQFGATHTHNNDCSPSIASSFEPGSGSTIMSYAGVCFPTVQMTSDPYFHGYNIQQINFVTTNTCATISVTNNNPPQAHAGRDLFLPIGTPFELVGSATDPDNQALTYCWEQMDSEFTKMPPEANATEGPSFRSFPPKESPNRYFPALEHILENESPEWEVLPLVDRSMEFRLTVRDNFAEGGCTDFDEMEIRFIEDAGPFKVLIPSAPIFYTSGSSQTVRWDVANTEKAPINVSRVNILLSIDGGFTYPIVLAENAANDGAQEVQFPDMLTDQARIKIQSIDNVFFDISDNNFSLTEKISDFDLTVTPDTASVCQGNAIQFTIDIGSIEGFSESVTLTSNANEYFNSSNFSNNQVTGGNSTIFTIGSADTPPGSYTIEIQGAFEENIKTKNIVLTVAPNEPVELSNIAPIDEEADISLNPTFEWISSDTNAIFHLEVAIDPSFNQLVIDEENIRGTNFTSSISLEHTRTYYWRVQANNKCGASDYSPFTQFTISNILCQIFASADVPEIISSEGTPLINSSLQLDEDGVIHSLRVIGINITHSWINDLTVKLQSPEGDSVILLDQICGNENLINITLGDNGSSHANLPCPPESPETFQGQESLDIFRDKEIRGTWNLTVKDHFNMDGGHLTSWALEVCQVVKENIPLGIVIANQGNPSCSDSADGFISPTLVGGTAPFDIQWNTGEERLAIENLEVGNYSVTVTDNNGTTATTTIELVAPTPIDISTSITSSRCAEGIDGTITINAIGGDLPYQYAWAHGPLTRTVNNLPAGVYTVTVSDANRCQLTSAITIEEAASINLSFVATNDTNGSNGAVDLSVEGGTPPYAYSWSNNINTQDLTALSAGTYSVVVTDAAGCTKLGQTEVVSEVDLDNCTDVNILITLDNYGSETSWDIKNSVGTSFIQGGSYTNFTKEEVQSATICLTPGCYDFTIYDLWGDGICCAYGNGAFQVVEVETGEILVEGSEFTTQDKTTFCIPSNDPETNLLSYCGANGKNTVYEWIEAVQINTTLFETGSNDGYYSNEAPVDIPMGSNIRLAFTPGFGFSPYGENWQVWIDWNRDGDLEDIGEQVFFGSGDQTVEGTVNIPSYAIAGNTKMRVAMKWGNQISPCESFNWGEVEDFVLNMLPGSGLTTIPNVQARIQTGEPKVFTKEQRFEDQVRVFPNPVQNQLTISWKTPAFDTPELIIYNSLGKVILQRNKITSNQEIEINTTSLPNGVYMAILKDDSKDISIRKEFVVAR